ncbi:DNA-formamidopyrimidine glycosylase family protein [Micromonospora sp. NPDC050187]|uniref:DNA-formamidopyrimidine glycosylase family protein n=1 Tax=Micromonospora sp. NPDC050187 TaxID=3364277 RepID=UPI0037A4DD23
MPEGDTVWNTARVLDRALAGHRLTGSDFRVPQLATTDLTGATVLGCVSRGKHLLLRLTSPGSSAGDRDAAWTLHSHLRMDGAWRAYAPGERWTGRPAHLIRVVLRTADAVAVGYHLHEVALVPTADEDALVGHLGPDLLGPDWDAAEAVRRLARQPDRPIGEALLDQRNLAGLGTVYTAEVLYLTGINPLTTVRRVEDTSRPVRLARRLLWANRGRSARATTGDTRRGHNLWVYGRQGQPCRRCGTVIMQGQHGWGPMARLAHWCPACQPERPPAAPPD